MEQRALYEARAAQPHSLPTQPALTRLLRPRYDLEPSERYLSNVRTVTFPQNSRGSIDDNVDASAPGPGWYTISETLVRKSTRRHRYASSAGATD